MVDYMSQYSQGSAKQVHPDKRKNDRLRGAFQARMFAAIMRTKPELLGEVMPSKKGEVPEVKQDKMAVTLFQPHMTNDLMFEWKKQGKPDMVDFLKSEEIL